jgi:hypothetical protein
MNEFNGRSSTAHPLLPLVPTIVKLLPCITELHICIALLGISLDFDRSFDIGCAFCGDSVFVPWLSNKQHGSLFFPHMQSQLLRAFPCRTPEVRFAGYLCVRLNISE